VNGPTMLHDISWVEPELHLPTSSNRHNIVAFNHRINTIQRSHFLISASEIFPVRHVLSKCPKERLSPPWKHFEI
jgi:hypothetical protein